MNTYQKLIMERTNGHKNWRDGLPAWNVKITDDVSYGDVRRSIIENSGCINEAELLLRCPDVEERFYAWINDSSYPHWGIIVDDMRRSVNADDWAKMCRPEFESKWRVKIDKPLSIDYYFTGRSGGWLVVEKFEGFDMRECRELAEYDRHPVFCRKLLAMWDEWDMMFTPKNAWREYVHQLGFRFVADVLEEVIV